MATANLVQTLASQTEGTRLDFKRRQYDWSAKGNAELAKDVMAMANALSLGDAPAYILIGVDQATDGTGRIVGSDASQASIDDSSLQQKVASLLNRTPDFSYKLVNVSGVVVGVFEIRPGRRPFFAVKDAHPLHRNAACVRSGSSTAIASPDEIQKWSYEDNLLRQRQALHVGLSRLLGFLVESAKVNPFHWSKHPMYASPVSEYAEKLADIKRAMESGSLRMQPLQAKFVVESCHEVREGIFALHSAAFNLSAEHGLVWLALSYCVARLAQLYPMRVELPATERYIRMGEDSFALNYYELVEHMLKFNDLRPTQAGGQRP